MNKLMVTALILSIISFITVIIVAFLIFFQGQDIDGKIEALDDKISKQKVEERVVLTPTPKPTIAVTSTPAVTPTLTPTFVASASSGTNLYETLDKKYSFTVPSGYTVFPEEDEESFTMDGATAILLFTKQGRIDFQSYLDTRPDGAHGGPVLDFQIEYSSQKGLLDYQSSHFTPDSDKTIKLGTHSVRKLSYYSDYALENMVNYHFDYNGQHFRIGVTADNTTAAEQLIASLKIQ